MKPKVRFIGEDGNVFSMIGRTTKALRNAGMDEEAKKFQAEVFAAKSYEEAIYIMTQYVDAF